MIEFFKTLLYIIMVVFFTASMGFSAIHTLHIAIGDPIIINKYIPFIVFYYICTTNAVNLTDGLDGLCSTVTVIVMIFLVR